MLEPEKNYREGGNEKRRRMEGNKVKEDKWRNKEQEWDTPELNRKMKER
jgi:hypothetical protein